MAKKEETLNTADIAAKLIHEGVMREWLSVDNLEQLYSDIQALLELMRLDMLPTALTHAEQMRLQGSGVRCYGFIDKTSDVAAANPEFAPAFFSSAKLKTKVREIEIVRNISGALQQMLRISDDVLLLLSDEAFQMALAYYNTVREASRRRQPGATAIFRQLQLFFRRGRRTDEEPTEPEVERDVKALLHGRKDGKIMIENEKPHTEGGKHVVVDETHKSGGKWESRESGEVEE